MFSNKSLELKFKELLLYLLEKYPNEICSFHSNYLQEYADFEIKKAVELNIGNNLTIEAESFFKTLKVEVVYQNKYKATEKAEKSITYYIENFYNNCRRHSALGNLTIEEFQNQRAIK